MQEKGCFESIKDKVVNRRMRDALAIVAILCGTAGIVNLILTTYDRSYLNAAIVFTGAAASLAMFSIYAMHGVTKSCDFPKNDDQGVEADDTVEAVDLVVSAACPCTNV